MTPIYSEQERTVPNDANQQNVDSKSIVRQPMIRDITNPLNDQKSTSPNLQYLQRQQVSLHRQSLKS